MQGVERLLQTDRGAGPRHLGKGVALQLAEKVEVRVAFSQSLRLGAEPCEVPRGLVPPPGGVECA